jgi:hypothetical protein
MECPALVASYAESLEGALREGTSRAQPGWMRPGLPFAIASSMQIAAELCGEEPAALADHYLARMPRELVNQRLRGSDPARALLWRPLERAQLPGFCAAIDGACALLREHGIEPRKILRGESSAELLQGNPCSLELVSESLLASGLPLLGAGDHERVEFARALEDPARDPDAVLDLHLGQHLAHELLHGIAQRPSEDDWHANDLLGPPWLVREAAALWLQARGHPRHVFPVIAGEAVPGVSLFVLAGEGLATALGADALLSALSEPQQWPARIGPSIAGLFAVAEWQEWLKRKSAPFAQDALRAGSWSKLAAAAKSLLTRSELELEPLRKLSAQIEALGLIRAARELPSVLDVADQIPWSATEAWHANDSAEDDRRAQIAVRALFQENAMAPIFVTRPAELRDGKIGLDVEACRLRASPRARGVFGEPAQWTFPPPLCRQLLARGARRIEIAGALRSGAEVLATALVAIARDHKSLESELHLMQDPEGRWTSSPR